MTDVMPPGPLSYLGQVATNYITRTFPPTTANNQFTVPTIWIDTNGKAAYILVAKPLGVADWVLMASSIGDIATITLLPDGTVINPVAGNVNFIEGTGVGIHGSSNNITFSAVGMGLTWNVVSTSQSLLVNNGYVAVSPGAGLQFSLPALSAVGDVIAITLDGATSWTITQGAGQQVRLGKLQSTSGASGSLVSTAQGNTMVLVCSIANTRWNAFAPQGNITIN